MPRKTKTAPRRRMKTKKYGARKPKRMVNVNRALAPFAQRYITKQKWSGVFTTSASSPIYRYRLNSLWDPDIIATTPSQPYAYDQLAILYNRYRVIACSYSINFYNASNVTRCVVVPANQTTFPNGVSDAVTNPRAQWKVQIPGGSTQTIRGKVYMPSIVGRNKAQYMADDRFQAQVDASPAETVDLNIFTADLADNGVGVTATVTLEFLVEFFDVKTLPASS